MCMKNVKVEACFDPGGDTKKKLWYKIIFYEMI